MCCELDEQIKRVSREVSGIGSAWNEFEVDYFAEVCMGVW